MEFMNVISVLVIVLVVLIFVIVQMKKEIRYARKAIDDLSIKLDEMRKDMGNE